MSLFLFNKNNSNNTLDNLWKDLHFCFRSSSCEVSISSRPHPAVWQQSVITHKIQIPIWLHPADPRHTLWPQTAGEYRRVGGCQQSRGRQQSASLSVHASIGIRRTLRARKLLSDNFTHSRFTWNYVKMHTCCCSGDRFEFHLRFISSCGWRYQWHVFLNCKRVNHLWLKAAGSAHTFPNVSRSDVWSAGCHFLFWSNGEKRISGGVNEQMYVWKQKDLVGKLPAGISHTGCAKRDRWATRDGNNWETYDITFTSHPRHQSFTASIVMSTGQCSLRPEDVFGMGRAFISCSAGSYPGMRKNLGSSHTCWNLSDLSCPLSLNISGQVVITSLSTRKLFIPVIWQ